MRAAREAAAASSSMQETGQNTQNSKVKQVENRQQANIKRENEEAMHCRHVKEWNVKVIYRLIRLKLISDVCLIRFSWAV